MIKAIVIDDEASARETLSIVLSKYCPDVQVVSTADSAQSGIAEIKKHKPELIFLDVEMPYGNGFDLLEKAGEKNFEVIFTTAYDEYAIRAIKFAALDYLLKPINIRELKAAVEKAIVKKRNESENKNLVETKTRMKKIALPTAHGQVFVVVDEIIRLQADDNYTHFFLTDGKKLLVSRTMKEFEELLEGNNFSRIHQTHLINIDHIKEYNRNDSEVKMADGSSIPVSRRNKMDFLKMLEKSRE